MISGLNDNIRYKDRDFHLQTEDGGPKASVITSHLFLSGAVLASRRTDYSHVTGKPEHETEVLQLMHRQHQDLRNELLSGRLDDIVGS